MEIKLEDLSLSIEQQIALFGKITASIRAIPSQRQKIREKLDPHTVTLLDALNTFLESAKQKLGEKQLVVIADNLDRIVPVMSEGRINHEEIFIDRNEQLKGLKCHVIYTVPISLVYSDKATDLRDLYGDVVTLPMVMVRTSSGKPYEAGEEKLKELIAKRVKLFDQTKDLVPDIFEEQALSRLMEMCGGHMRNLMLLVQSAIDYIDELPITLKAMSRAIAKAREQLRLVPEVNDDINHWEVLKTVAKTKKIENAPQYQQLLFNRCILQFCEDDEEGNARAWYDVHPLLTETPEFKDGGEDGSARS